MVSADGRFVLTYNGEVYNYQPIRADLEALDYPFKGHSDTEVLLAGIVCWGLVETLRRANGMFALAVWDRQEHTLTLARDRTGKKPLYYGWCNGTFLFASELKALRKHPAFIADIDRDALGLYVRYSWMPAPYTIFRGIRHLPAASILRVTPNGPHGQHPGAQKIRWSGLSQHPACMLG
jgi:asparagine synthase (glutamine-hydrolysing)